MKQAIVAGLTASAAVLAFSWLAAGQADPGRSNTELKHLTVAPLKGSRAVAVSALSIERGTHYPSIIQLKGNVEIKTPICVPVSQQSGPVCDGDMIVRADEAEFDEDTGEIQAHGSVTVTPVRHKT